MATSFWTSQENVYNIILSRRVKTCVPIRYTVNAAIQNQGLVPVAAIALAFVVLSFALVLPLPLLHHVAPTCIGAGAWLLLLLLLLLLAVIACSLLDDAAVH